MKKGLQEQIEALSNPELEEIMIFCLRKFNIKSMTPDNQVLFLNSVLRLVAQHIDIAAMLQYTTISLDTSEQLKSYHRQFNEQYFQSRCNHNFSK